jgi:hypothetical protein
MDARINDMIENMRCLFSRSHEEHNGHEDLLEKTFFRDERTSYYEEHKELFWKRLLRVLREPSCLREDVIPPWTLSRSRAAFTWPMIPRIDPDRRPARAA